MKKSGSYVINTILTGLVAALLVLLNLQILNIKQFFGEPALAAGLAPQSKASSSSAPSAAAALVIADIRQSDHAKSSMASVKQQLSGRTKLDDFLAPALWEGSLPGSAAGTITITGSDECAEAYRRYDGFLPLGTYLYLDFEASDVDSIDWITLYLMEDLNYANYFEIDLLPGLKAGELIFNKKDVLTGSGTPRWDEVSALKIAFGTKNGKEVSVTLDEICTYSASPMCSIWFDDGWKTTYTDAFPVMREKGFKGILSVVSSYVGCTAFCNEADLNDMYANGWDFTNHTDDHRNLSELSAQEAEEEITSCFNYLVSHGYTRAADNVVPPYCAVTDETDEMISRLAATSRVCYSKYNLLPITDPYHLGFREVFSDTSPKTAMQWIDEAIENDLWLVLLFHSIESPTDESTKYSKENFKKIMDYLDQKRSEVDVVTLSDILGADIIKTSGETALKADTVSGRELIFEDEFNASLNSEVWNVIEAEPFKNNELQTYTKDATLAEGGMLKITSEKEGKLYTSGALTTENKQLFQYGRIEIRAKLPTGKGIFPAFWLLPQSGDPYPEVDIIEFLGHDPDSIWHVMHYESGGEKRKYSRKYEGEAFDQGFHIFALEWTKESLKWFIDGVETYSVSDNIPSEKMFLYLNTAVGGDWPGDPGDSTQFPQTMLIDYIKYYR